MDKYGIEHWITTDQYGNEVECFANKFAEVHTKRPICICGEPMVCTREFEWDCPKCGAHLESEDISRSINPDDYMTSDLEPDEDYGEYKYMDDDYGSRMFLAGAPGYEIDFFHLI